jgi:hypothetical protein
MYISPFYLRQKWPTWRSIFVFRVGTSDFDAQMPGIKFWKGNENLRPVRQKPFYESIEWLFAFWTLVKSAPKESFAKKTDFPCGQMVFWLKLFLGALFTKIKFTLLKSAGKTDFLRPHSPFLKKIHLL